MVENKLRLEGARRLVTEEDVGRAWRVGRGRDVRLTRKGSKDNRGATGATRGWMVVPYAEAGLCEGLVVTRKKDLVRICNSIWRRALIRADVHVQMSGASSMTYTRQRLVIAKVLR